jgi:hypothetical protein
MLRDPGSNHLLLFVEGLQPFGPQLLLALPRRIEVCAEPPERFCGYVMSQTVVRGNVEVHAATLIL